MNKVLLLSLLFGASVHGMNLDSEASMQEEPSVYSEPVRVMNVGLPRSPNFQVQKISAVQSRDLPVMQPVARKERADTETYMPRNLSVANMLKNEATCCFCTARWILQPINIIAPLIAGGLVAAGEYFIKSDPRRAEILNLCGLGFSVADFISGVLLLKVNNKLEGIDDYFDQQLQNNNRGNNPEA